VERFRALVVCCEDPLVVKMCAPRAESNRCSFCLVGCRWLFVVCQGLFVALYSGFF